MEIRYLVYALLELYVDADTGRLMTRDVTEIPYSPVLEAPHVRHISNLFRYLVNSLLNLFNQL